jgi:hypothetical protein
MKNGPRKEKTEEKHKKRLNKEPINQHFYRNKNQQGQKIAFFTFCPENDEDCSNPHIDAQGNRTEKP